MPSRTCNAVHELIRKNVEMMKTLVRHRKTCDRQISNKIFVHGLQPGHNLLAHSSTSSMLLPLPSLLSLFLSSVFATV